MNHLYYGDNLEVLRASIDDESVDLVYLDPPFNSQANYNVLFRAPSGAESQAQIEVFEDTWHWNASAERAFDEVMQSGRTDVSEILNAFRSFLKENDMMAYLTMMAVRLIELHRVLKLTGSLYLHCDPTASHYLKVVLDGIFGKSNFKNEISWKRSSAHSDAKQGMRRCGRIRDTLLFYTKSNEYTWNTLYTKYNQLYLATEYKHKDENNRLYKEADLTAAKPGGDTEYDWWVKRPIGSSERWVADLADEHDQPLDGWDYLAARPYAGRYWAYSKTNLIEYVRLGKLIHRETGVPRLKLYADEMPGVPLQDIWDDISPASGDEDLGFPTQKPEALLERIVAASSNEGDTVLDPFCGCGTTIHAAQKLRRTWIGIDVTHLAISLIEKRLTDAFAGIKFEVHGTPKDLAGAKALAATDKYQFQWWAISLIDAAPYGGKKKGADSGIDGFVYFKADGKKTEKAIVSVKGGESVSVPMIRDLGHVVDREKAKIGVLITLTRPTKPMLVEAVKAGYFVSPFGKFPKIQIFTIEELLSGKRPQIPFVQPVFKKAGEASMAVQQAIDF